MTAVYLINRTPSRLLGWKTPYEMLIGVNEFIVPPKVFGCTLSGIIGLLLESWILEQSNAYLWVIHQVKRGTSVGVPLNIVSL